MAYSVEAALLSGMFDIVHVSTDSEKYAEIAKRYGADVPFLRSAENSSDTASSWDTVLEVLEKYSKLGKSFDNVMLLQPTSPLRKSDDIIAAFSLMDYKKANSIVSVCQGHYHNTLPADGTLTDFFRNGENNKRRQDTDTFYRVNGAIFLINTAYFLNDQNIYRSSSFAYIMDKRRSVDIDDEIDFLFAEIVLINEGKPLSQTP
jgi:CMP-N,N'-diacetyllegionaminic acid synthase